MTEIKDYITNDFKGINSEETIAEVHDFFHELPFSHFPVLEENVYIGCITLDDIETFEKDKKVSDYKYTLEGFFARNSMIWLDVELEDIIKFFHETPFLKEPGGIIVVEKPVLDYSMSQIAQIVESNNGKLLGLFISESDVEKVQVTIKISLGAMNDIIQTFRRYNYEILSEHHEDLYINNLKERSDYLDKYLNI